MHLKAVLLASTLACSSLYASAQQTSAQATVGAMTEAAIEAQLNVAAKPETAERIATFKRNLYESLLKKGFNGLDAMQMVINTPLPSVSPSAK